MIEFRICKPDDGRAIAALLVRCHDPNVEPHGVMPDWSIVENWIMAEDDGELVGCVAFASAVPIGFAEHLTIDPVIQGMARARLVHRLTGMVHVILKGQGCSALIYLVPDGHSSWRNALLARGARPATRGTILVRGL